MGVFELDSIVIGICLVGFFVIYDLADFSILCLLIMAALLLYVGSKKRNEILTDQNKKKLVVTARIKRLIFTITILFLIPLLYLGFHITDSKICWLVFLILSIMTYLNCYVVFLALIINTPVEKLVYLHFKTMAQNKLNSMNNLKIIGITGSYGKTSSKRILSEILNIKYNALPTPRNLNTYNGLIMTVNNYMDKFTDIFIAEMGAYVKGEIAGLCRLIKPKYGILTTIGTAHLESFGSEENIIEGKFELIESLPSDGFAILNGDDPKQVNYHLKNKVKVIWIGIDNEEAAVRAKNIKCSSKGTTFDVVLKGKKETYKFETSNEKEALISQIQAARAVKVNLASTLRSLTESAKLIKRGERSDYNAPREGFGAHEAYSRVMLGLTRHADELRETWDSDDVLTIDDIAIQEGISYDEALKKFEDYISNTTAVERGQAPTEDQ